MFDIASAAIKEFATGFKEGLIETQKRVKSPLRYTVEVLPILEYNFEQNTYKEGKETTLRLWNPKGCIQEDEFTELIDDAKNSDSSQAKEMFGLLNTFGISSVSEWLTGYIEGERKKEKADKYFFMLFLKDVEKKNKLTRKIRTKTVGIFQMIIQKNDTYKILQEQIV